MNIGDRIRTARISKGLTQSELGALSGMADSAIRRYESNRVNPTAKSLQRIADALNVSVDYLVGIHHLKGIINYKSASIRDRIFTAVNQMGISNEEFCVKVGLPPDEWFKWKEAVSESYLDHLPEISKLLGISEDVLSGKIPDTTPPGRIRLDQAFSKLNSSGQREAVKRVEELTEIPKYRLQEPQDGPEG